MFRNLETNYYLCTDKIKKMARSNPKVAYLEEALSFIESIPKSAGDKLHNKVKYRLFAFWDTQTDTLVIATHGIIKKTQKTPKKEIAKAERIRQEYFDAKK